MTALEAVLELRKGGVTQRCHTVPTVGVHQTVAAHSWGVAILVMQLNPSASKELLLAALTHDIAENWTGDIPAHAKWRWPALKAVSYGAEEEVNRRLGINVQLTPQEQAWLDGCDLLELALHSYDQLMLGNRNFAVILYRCVEHAGKSHHFPHEVVKLIDQLADKALQLRLA
jgi:hypothetical protein